MPKLLLALVSTLLMAGANASAAHHERPNILFVIGDDITWKHMGAYGCEWVNTPGFDRIAREGILFNRAYTSNAKCSPSRSSIVTGRNSWQLEAAANHWPYFPPKFKSVAEVLDENGYHVGYTGKGWAPGVVKHEDGSPRDLLVNRYSEARTVAPTHEITSIDYAENFRLFLEDRDPGQPFFFWYGSLEPHRAYEYQSGVRKGGKQLSDIDQVPAFWPDTPETRHDMLDYAYEIDYFDHHLVAMLNLLEAEGLLGNTMIVVTADNGMPFPRAKANSYEYSNHLPLAIMWPRGIQGAGRAVDDIINFSDFAPTFLEIAGISEDESGMQPIEGTSLVDILQSGKAGQNRPGEQFMLIGKERHDIGRPGDAGYPMRGIVRGEFLYIRNYQPDLWPAGNPETGYLATDGGAIKTYLIDNRKNLETYKFWELNLGKRPAEELYHIGSDPECIRNLAEHPQYQELKVELEKLMLAELAEQGDPRTLGDPDYFMQFHYSNAAQRNFYEKYLKGEIGPENTGWVFPTDYDEKLD